ncbi:MAG: alpha/beta hydrolase [Solirubrobacterales bacterium]|nr:alpha/beta hydrolase [Solirubrobacterales bacterium]
MKLMGLVLVALLAILIAACGGDDESSTAASTATLPASADIDRVVPIGGGRGLYLRCTGSGSPTVVMEGGDEDTGESYDFAVPEVSKVARTCVYDRANLGRSDPTPGPRGLKALVGDLERVLEVAAVPKPYVLVGTSGGGYITAGYAYAHPRQVAGMVFIEVPGPFHDPPREIIEATDPEAPENIEKRDYLQVEKDAWAARRRIGDVPVTIVSDKPSAAAIREAQFASEARGMRRNVEIQKGWLVLSPRAKQVVVRTGHAVEEEDPQLVIDTILDVVRAAR